MYQIRDTMLVFIEVFMQLNLKTFKICSLTTLKTSSRLASNTAEVFLAATCETFPDDQLLLSEKEGLELIELSKNKLNRKCQIENNDKDLCFVSQK